MKSRYIAFIRLDNFNPSVTMSSREHILQVPVVVTGLRIVQLVVALATLGLAAYGVTYLSFDGDDLTLFTVRSPKFQHYTSCG